MKYLHAKNIKLITILGLSLLFSALILIGMKGVGKAEGNIQISEFMPNPTAVSDANGEWIEIANPGTDVVDITGWKIDGQTINGVTSIDPGDAIVVCRNIESSQNGGVICDGQRSFSFSNGGDTIELTDGEDKVVDSLTYISDDVLAGSSLEISDSFTPNTTHQYGDGDFGTPANNPFGVMIVNVIEEINKNMKPDLLANELTVSDINITLFKNGELRNQINSSELNFPDSAMLVTSPGVYQVCAEIPDTYHETFSVEALSFTSFVDKKSSNGPLCSEVTLLSGEWRNLMFGMRKKEAGQPVIRMHVVGDYNSNGYPDFPNEQRLEDWTFRIYDTLALDFDPNASHISEVTSTGLAFTQSATFTPQNEEYTVCLVKSAGFNQTFARQIVSWTEAIDASVQKVVNPSDEYESCASVDLSNGTHSIVFGVSQE